MQDMVFAQIWYSQRVKFPNSELKTTRYFPHFTVYHVGY